MISLPLVELEGIKRDFVNGAVTTKVLKGISLQVEQGEYISIMGASGSGKSTLLNIIGCLDRPTEGKHFFGGCQVDALGDGELADIRNRSLGFVFQTFHLLRNLTAIHNVELPLIYRGIPKKERMKRAAEALGTMGLAERKDHLPSQMSGGEQQRVAIARAIVGKPRLLLADEPTGALDSKNSLKIMEIFSQLHQEHGLTIVQVTHDLNVAKHGNRIIFMADGEIVREEQIEKTQ